MICYTHSHKWSKVNPKRTPPRSIFYTCDLSFFFSFLFLYFICQKLQVHNMTFPIHQIHNSVQLLRAETHAKPDSPCLTLCNFHLRLHAWHNSGHRKKITIPRQKNLKVRPVYKKNKSKLLYVCIVITLEYLNSFTINKNTHIKKIFQFQINLTFNKKEISKFLPQVCSLAFSTWVF